MSDEDTDCLSKIALSRGLVLQFNQHLLSMRKFVQVGRDRMQNKNCTIRLAHIICKLLVVYTIRILYKIVQMCTWLVIHDQITEYVLVLNMESCSQFVTASS